MTFPQSIHFGISEAVRFLTPMAVATEWLILALSVLLILTAPAFLLKRLEPVARVFRWLAVRPRLAMLICATLPVLLRLALLPVIPVPQPSIHDEFSHLLLADTLARGRLTNPTPAMWAHFESIHIIQKPTYNSMYLPGNAVFLAAGQILFHQPWAGVELAIACMCASLYWMFRGWLSQSWALFGVLIVILKLTLISFWVNSYMGGSVPVIGGALVLGSLPRVQRDPTKRLNALMLGLGAVVLMNSRPFEGGILTSLVVAVLVWSLRREIYSSPLGFLNRLVVPAAAIVMIGLAGLGYYCWRVTGNPLRMPYQVNRATYGWPENLAFLPPEKISSPHPVLQRMYELEISRRGIYDDVPVLIDNFTTRLFDNWIYFIGPMLTLPLVFAIFAPDRKTRLLLFFLLSAAAINVFQLVLYPYHLGPVVPALFCLVAIGCQQLFEQLKRLEPSRALCFVVLLPLCLLLVDGLKQFGDEVDIPVSSYWERGYESHRDARAAIVQWLKNRPGKHLVIVRYDPSHSVNQEWVYNGADLQGSKILWARDMGDSSNQQLLDYYPKRYAWLVEADVYPQRVVPYPKLDEDGEPIPDCSPCAASRK